MFLYHLKRNGVLRYISFLDIHRGVMIIDGPDGLIRVKYFYIEGNLAVYVNDYVRDVTRRYGNRVEIRSRPHWVSWGDYAGRPWSSVLHKGDIISGIKVALYLIACAYVCIKKHAIWSPTFGEYGSIEDQNNRKYSEAVREGWCSSFKERVADWRHSKRIMKINTRIANNGDASLIKVSGNRWVTPDYKFVVTRDRKTETYSVRGCKARPGKLPAPGGVLDSRVALQRDGMTANDCARFVFESFLMKKESDLCRGK